MKLSCVEPSPSGDGRPQTFPIDQGFRPGTCRPAASRRCAVRCGGPPDRKSQPQVPCLKLWSNTRAGPAVSIPGREANRGQQGSKGGGSRFVGSNVGLVRMAGLFLSVCSAPHRLRPCFTRLDATPAGPTGCDTGALPSVLLQATRRCKCAHGASRLAPRRPPAKARANPRRHAGGRNLSACLNNTEASGVERRKKNAVGAAVQLAVRALEKPNCLTCND